MNVKNPILILSLFIFSYSSICQIDTIKAHQYFYPTLSLPNTVNFGFDKNVNTHKWDANIYYQNSFSNLDVIIDERFRSTLIKTNRKLIKDEQTIDIFGKYKISEPVKASVYMSSFVLADNQSIGISNASSHGLYGGFEYRPIDQIIMEPLIGFRIDRQINEYDNGLSFMFNGKTENLEFSGFKTLISGNIKSDNLSPRYLGTWGGIISVEKNFFEKTRNAFNLIYKKNHREFYFAADTEAREQFNITNNIERRVENQISMLDSIDYNFGSGLQLSLNGLVVFRNIDRSTKYKPLQSRIYDNSINDFKIEGSTQFSFNPSKVFNGNIQLFYGEREVLYTLQDDFTIDEAFFQKRKKDEEKKNNNSRRTTLLANILIDVTKSDRIMLSGSSSILRYDTPSKDNDDDRDELWMAYNITTFHNLSQHFNMRISLDINLNHIVYLLGSRSANNNWNRIFRLSPQFQYIPSKYFSTTNTFEVLANYTVYDFEDQLESIKSFSFRQFSFIDSSSISITSKVGLDWYNYIRLYERGELNWPAFKGRPINYFEDKTYIGQIRYGSQNDLLFSVGIRYFSQTRFGYQGRSKYIETYLRSVGPVANVSMSFLPKAQIIIKGWHEKIDFTGAKTRESTTFVMNVKIYM